MDGDSCSSDCRLGTKPTWDCPATTVDNCLVAAINVGSQDGTCKDGFMGSCLYLCVNGYPSRLSNSCAPRNTVAQRFQTPAMVPPVESNAKIVNADTQAKSTQAIGSSEKKDLASQQEAKTVSLEVVSTGANQAATSAAIFCAEGAVKAIDDASNGAEDLKNCKDQFASANEMKTMQEKMGKTDGFKPDPEVMGHSGTATVLGQFTQNFGVDGDEYVRRMLGARGSWDEFAAMLKSKLTDAQIAAALAAADAAPSSASSLVYDPGSSSSVKKSGNPLRDSLKNKLADTTAAREPASAPRAAVAEKRSFKNEHLEPLSGDSFFGSKPEHKELTIFDVVHLRYQKCYDRLGQ